mgnify:CR=1 FL=1
MKKAFVSCEQRKRFSRGLLVPIVSVIIVVGFVIYGVGNVSRSASQERLKAAEQNLERLDDVIGEILKRNVAHDNADLARNLREIKPRNLSPLFAIFD